MEREIVLTSYNNKSGKNKPSDFTTPFVQPITLAKNREYVVGLNRIINMSFTWFNVNSMKRKPGERNIWTCLRAILAFFLRWSKSAAFLG